jgi:hypothetical protein
VSRLLLQSQEAPPPGVALSLFYTARARKTRLNADADADADADAAAEGVVYLDPEQQGVVFDDEVVEEARGLFERIVGTREGFMRLPEEARRLMDEMEEA